MSPNATSGFFGVVGIVWRRVVQLENSYHGLQVNFNYISTHNELNIGTSESPMIFFTINFNKDV